MDCFVALACSNNFNTAHDPNSNSSKWFVETLAVRISVTTDEVSTKKVLSSGESDDYSGEGSDLR